jgi:hypothetical protein
VDGVGSMLVIEARRGGAQSEASRVYHRSKEDGAGARLVAPSIGALIRMWLDVFEAAIARYDRARDRWIIDLERLPAGFDERLLSSAASARTVERRRARRIRRCRAKLRTLKPTHRTTLR